MAGYAPTYSEIRVQVVKCAEEHLSDKHLKNFISTFQPIINSKRRSSYVNNFNDLITILEKRGHVGETDIAPYQEIINLLPNPDILNEIMSDFQVHRSRNRIQGLYMNHGPTAPFYSQNNSSGSGRSRRSDSFTNNNSVLPEAVLDRVCKDIGTHWRDLARNLSIREGEIDDIEVQYPRNLKERAYECMKRFINETDPYKVRQKLLRALDECGRRDLREDVEEILNRRA
ncbi:fas-associated death domain protein [Cryptotermes secundus]|uniref:fas-associated death domain protein n=1 Tax=Cryptotermes secundus TaxID=105785 RepID=UPI000CD7B26D|nr:fas-associated death domain protein [Cryptotermes secundus]